ncbi:hypothetical protein [Streptococcus parauberis]|uniref:hypothetical protein n=1 Tax=Streptococcus parauberis TaxID=1348 RepID=UPI000789B6B4|nr:hypothetical protein [Streptococcus parauberis]KYP20852.1 hypothetical protein AKL13_00474 [Streptococcus parauberis]KYP21236.1 hypothetical protein TN39_00397 [Streptococcus parauberis]KYP22368.1 hypothetical protein AKL14_00365 [Streptococcus parauberis]KYP24895.1 hypothetical protein ADO04_01181 [Streptococcus parauberis]KYP25872.1 hypothetical protein TP84_01250 [Streptococcus parauberis]
MKIGIVNGFDVYEHRVDLLYYFFEKAGHEVNVYTTNFLHREKKYRTEFNSNYNYVTAEQYKKNMSIARLKSHFNLSKDIFSEIPNDLDLLWVILPPNSFTKQAANYKENNPTVKVVVDILDMWPETLPVGKIKNFFPFNLWKKIRNDNLSVMDFVVTECDYFQEKIKDFIPLEKRSTLYLSYGNIDNFDIKNNTLPNDKISLCYLGSVNNIIDIECIKNIIKNLSKNQQVILHIIGGGEKEEELVRIATIAGAEVINHGKVYDIAIKNKIFDSCHFGLNIMKKSVYVGLTMKSIDYLKAGLPLINNIVGDTWDFVEKYQIGENTVDGEINFHYMNYDYVVKEKVKRFYMEYFSEQVFFNNLEQILKRVINMNGDR